MVVNTGFTPKIKELNYDQKKKCEKCNQHRSLSLMLADQCVFCFHSIDTPDTDEQRSRLVQCHGCSGIYAVGRFELLAGIPKCHYCRNNQKSPCNVCQECCNHFIVSNGENFSTCQNCLHGKGIVSLDVSIRNLLEENPKIIGTLGIFVGGDIDRKLFALKGDVLLLASEKLEKLTYKNKPVFNVKEVLSSIREWVEGGRYEKVACYLCANSLHRSKFLSACGTCTTEACVECLKSWYGQVQPGKFVNPSNLSCPFCKGRVN